MTHPKPVLAIWLGIIAVLGVLGLGLESKLSTVAVYVPGTPSGQAEQLKIRAFGNQDPLVVMLRGPAREADRQGRLLARNLTLMPHSAGVVSPWSGPTIGRLHPSPNIVAMVVSVERAKGQQFTDIVKPVRREIDSTIRPPVRAALTGQAVIALSAQKEALKAEQTAELVAFPVLAVVLLLVFGSPLAALIPGVIGGTTVAAGRGVIDLLLGSTTFDALAPGIAAMMGLALGVDYSLLVVSRFREEVGAGASRPAAARLSILSTGRSVTFAGMALLLAMVVAGHLLPGAIVRSIAIAIIISSIFSVLAAIFIVPAMLVLAGPRLERWSIYRRSPGTGGFAARVSRRVTRRPLIVSALILLALLIATSQASAVKTGPPSTGLLPANDRGRQDYLAVQHALGPGWGGGFTVLVNGGSTPVTTPARLRAMTRFQERAERDPGIQTMAGLAPIARSTRALDQLPGTLSSLNQQLAAGKGGLARLDTGLGQAAAGAGQAEAGLSAAASGASLLQGGGDQASSGARLLHDGMQVAATGSSKLLDGMKRAYSASEQLVAGDNRAASGAGQLASGISRALGRVPALPAGARQLAGALRSGGSQLGQLRQPVAVAQDQLASAWQDLLAMTIGKADPRYLAALDAVGHARAAVTGRDPVTGRQVDPRYPGLDAALAQAQAASAQAANGADRLATGGDDLVRGLRTLETGAARLEAGVRQLASGNQRLAGGMTQLVGGGEQMTSGLTQLTSQTGRLASGLARLNSGAGTLASQLRAGAPQAAQLGAGLGTLQQGVEAQRGQLPAPGGNLDSLRARSPDFFRSGYLYLAALDGAASDRRRQASFVVDIDRGGHVARMWIIPTTPPLDPRSEQTRKRLERYADKLASDTNAQVLVGGDEPVLNDYNAKMRSAIPLATVLLSLMTLLVLVPVLRSILVPLVAVVLNVVTVGTTFAVLALLFDHSFLGGPGYIDTISSGSIVAVIFGLSIDYEVFVLSRIREEYLRTRDSAQAIERGVGGTARVVTGAAVIMMAVFIAFGFANFMSIRNFGVALAIAVAIDAFIIRLIALPAIMRLLGDRCWWMPAWLQRLLPRIDLEAPALGAHAGARA